MAFPGKMMSDIFIFSLLLFLEKEIAVIGLYGEYPSTQKGPLGLEPQDKPQCQSQDTGPVQTKQPIYNEKENQTQNPEQDQGHGQDETNTGPVQTKQPIYNEKENQTQNPEQDQGHGQDETRMPGENSNKEPMPLYDRQQ
ncbi:PREDICTED: semenogelin-2-like, partial [Galeopterus variegatus]|uniref:Semenogelin-2-like n=1 Tax=Galeopterus variegatus TaxID=482537 RepID=A0ABM0S4I9_GALVR